MENGGVVALKQRSLLGLFRSIDRQFLRGPRTVEEVPPRNFSLRELDLARGGRLGFSQRRSRISLSRKLGGIKSPCSRPVLSKAT